MVAAMNEVTLTTDRLRDKIKARGVSLREIARRAAVSDSTVRRFVEHGNANLKIVARIEQAVSDLAPAESATGPSSDVVQ
jgi:transcriptional regulator with XRE-family HTH domain